MRGVWAIPAHLTGKPCAGSDVVTSPAPDISAEMMCRSAVNFAGLQRSNHVRTDRLFAWLLIIEWTAGMLAAIFVSPRQWSGERTPIDPHVWATVLLGALVVSLPVIMGFTRSGEVATRHAIAAAQMITSAMLIHLTSGRIETHFHVFGS